MGLLQWTTSSFPCSLCGEGIICMQWFLLSDLCLKPSLFSVAHIKSLSRNRFRHDLTHSGGSQCSHCVSGDPAVAKRLLQGVWRCFRRGSRAAYGSKNKQNKNIHNLLIKFDLLSFIPQTRQKYNCTCFMSFRKRGESEKLRLWHELRLQKAHDESCPTGKFWGRIPSCG